MQETQTWKEWLPLLLDPENKESQRLDRSVRTTILEVLDEVEEQGRLEELLTSVQDETASKGVHPAGHALMGLAHLRAERPSEATPILTSLCNRLEKERRWEALAWVAQPFFESTGALKAARFLTKVAEEGGRQALPEGLLDRLYEAFPDEYRIAYLKAQQAREAGEEEDARQYLLQSLQGFLQTQRRDKIEEIYLELVGSVDEETHHALFRGAVRLAKKRWEMAEPLLELLLPHLASPNMAREAWDTFLEMLPRETTATSTLRHFLRAVAPAAFPDVTDLESILRQSGVFDDETPPDIAVRNLKAVLDLAPGYYVLHATWGVGRIANNDGESIIIDFIPDKPGHRMGLKLATRALEVLAHDDLRVLEVSQREELVRLAREDPAHLVFLALRESGGQATTTMLKKRLGGIVAPVRSWATWWKETKERLEEHPRIDLSLAFRNTYRIIEGLGGEEEVPLPSLDRKRGVRTNLNLIRRFLEQHPGSKGASRHIHGPILKRWVHDDRTRAHDRVALYLFLSDELDLHEDGMDAAFRDALAEGLEPTDAGEARHQMTVLDAGLASESSRADAILFGLASRHPDVREKALGALREDPQGGRTLLRDLLRNPSQRPVTALAVIQQTVTADPDDPLWPHPWEAAYSTAILADVTTRDVLRRQAIAFLDPQGPLAERARLRPPAEDAASRWTHILTHWRSSERALFHVYKFLKATGLESVAEEVSRLRSEATNRALDSVGGRIEIHGIPMTQKTYEKLLEEREAVQYALRTTIPEAIKKARELGDLRENAEYDAAKLKQAQESERLSKLNARIQQAEIIEHIGWTEGQAGPGTEIVLEDPSTGTRETHWILGEGDNWLDEHVVSVMAPLGQAVLGHRAGDMVRVEESGGSREWRLADVRRKLP